MTEVSARFEEAQAIISKMSMKRWRTIEIRLDADMQEVMQSMTLLLPVLAHELWRADEAKAGLPPKKDDWDRFEDMGISELNEFLGLSQPDEDATKSGESEPADS